MARKNKGGAGGPFLSGGPDGLSEEALFALFAGEARGQSGKSAGKSIRKAPPGPGKKPGRGRILPLDDIVRSLGASRRKVENLLSELTAAGRLVRLKGPAYALPEALPTVTGRLSLQRKGIGFVRPEDGRGQDVYIHQSQLGGAWNGDLVRAAILPGGHGKSPEGRVVDVLERSAKELAVELLPQLVDEGGGRCRLGRPLDARMPGYVLVDFALLPDGKTGEGGARMPGPGSVVLARVKAASEQRNDGVVRVSFAGELGRQDSIFVYERVVKATHGISVEFPAAVVEEAGKLPEDPVFSEAGDGYVTDERGLKRRDLRHLDLVTIDGADARDFDDAVLVEKTDDGYLLRVGIADVAHYVTGGSPLDREARLRGNSSYFPASVEPMLPFELSGGLCSLRPGRPRLAMLAEVEFDRSGKPGKTRFYPALIQSSARLTYEEVQNFLDGTGESGGNGALESAPGRENSRVAAMLLLAAELARILVKRRRERGALDFDLPEALVRVDKEGRVRGLEFRKHLFAHSLIEEFMIAANEAVARHLAGYADGGLNFLYRAHPAPDPEKLRDLAALLKRGGLDVKLPELPSPRDLQALLAAVRGRPDEFVVNRMLLRSLMQARYTPEPEGHFGLASGAYCHFTSPIRRYADLAVHRALRRSLGIKENTPDFATLAVLAEDLNDSERKAQEAERDINKTAAALFLQGREGEEFEAVVSGLSAFGLFVELAEYPVEGFVPLESLGDDYFQLRGQDQILLGQRTGLSFRPGQRLAVGLRSVNPLRLEIDFEPLGLDARKSGRKAGKSDKSVRSVKSGKSGKSGNSGGGREHRRKPGRNGARFKPGSVRVREK